MGEIPAADWTWINAAAERFEQGWKQGRRPRIEDFLAGVAAEQRAALLDELLRVELELRRRAGEPPTAQEYHVRFPDLAAVVDAVFGAGSPERGDLAGSNGSPGALGEPWRDPLSFRSTDFDGPPGQKDEHSQRSSAWARGYKPAAHEADTWPSQGALPSTVSAPPDGVPPLEQPGPGMAGWRVGRYLLIERLGGGNQGHVWRAVELEPIVRSVALKVLPPGIAPDDERVDRLGKEAKRGGGLSHPAILPVFDFGSCDGYTFLAMQLVEGFPLSHLLARRRAWLAGTAPANVPRMAILPEAEYTREMVRLLARIARALEHAHDHHIVHRDVKPSNILIEREDQERVFLSDFGLARDLEDLTTDPASSWVGTLPYMGPEKLLGRHTVDEVRCDIFAFGVTLFESTTLKRPIELPESLSPAAAAAWLATTEPRRPRFLQPHLRRDLEAVIVKSIDRNPTLRYPTAGELADDLDRYLRGEPVRARPPGRARKVYRRLYRHRLAISIVCVSMLVGFTALLVRWAITREHALRAAKYRQLAEDRFRAGRFDEADELVAAAQSLVPGDPKTTDLLALLRSERVNALADDIDRDDVGGAWRNWKKLNPADGAFFSQMIFDAQTSLQPLRVVSEVPGTRVVFHGQHPDGRPSQGVPLYELYAGPLIDASEDLERTFQADLKVIPGEYWVTALVDGTDTFVERPFTVRRDRSLRSFSHTLRLYPKTTRDASAGMVEIPAGTLKMGSNELLPGDGLIKDAPPEYPAHDVPMRGFYLDRTEVTNRAFFEFLVATGCEEWGRGIWPDHDGRPDPARLDWPVTNLTRREAVEFAAWRGCCLPDESQLEWAARGPDGLERPKDVAPDSPSEPWTRLHAVDSEPRDRTTIWSQPILGLCGNASEITLFRFRPYPHPYGSASSTARIGYVIRSGAFHDVAGKKVPLGYIRRASQVPEIRNTYVGFRCARSIESRIKVRLNP